MSSTSNPSIKMTFKEISDAVIDNKMNGTKTSVTLKSNSYTQTPSKPFAHQTTQTNQVTSFKINNGVFIFH